ncbi:MAG: type I-U CRISPR-associated helicase/endonuclease Cas3 [Verrucomicrobiota bacterium]
MANFSFHQTFELLTGFSPLPWQQALSERFASGANHIPSRCDLPTGLGKTSVVAIWLIALANNPGSIPRRLVYVVNRRTVIDQTTEEVEKIRHNLVKPELADFLTALKSLCAIDCDCPLAISTLRGQFADNREWSADPCRAALIAGTVDMIGSRLLFSGYGIGFKTKPLHAGFLGQDTLLVHDEAHLEPAFQKLLTQIEEEQKRCGDARMLRVMELSATTRVDNSASSRHAAEPFGLTEDEEEKSPLVKERLRAPKRLSLIPLEDPKKLPDKLAELALARKESNRAILVFARTVKDVEAIAESLRKTKQKQVEVLTGTLRGKERDALVETLVFRRFLPPSSVTDTKPVSMAEGTVYLICTSAGEVGLNISGDDLICDLSTFESMAQRFGRVNRFGKRTDTEICVIHPVKFDANKWMEPQLEKTLGLLQMLNGDASPGALRNLQNRNATMCSEAFSPTPAILPTSDILFDSWSLTSIRGALPGRPPVEAYLHGIVEDEQPLTQVGWREEVKVITEELRETYAPADLLDEYPLKPHELLRDRSDRVWNHLAEIEKRTGSLPVWLIDPSGAVEPLTLDQLADKRAKERIHHCTLLLPPDAGGLEKGLLNGKSEHADDVADYSYDHQPRRVRVWDTNVKGMRLILTIDTRPTDDGDDGSEDGTPKRRFWSWYETPNAADREGSRYAQQAIPLKDHSDLVGGIARDFAQKLGLAPEMVLAIALAGRFHDLGKKREIWQRSIGNFELGVWLAKSTGRMNFSIRTPYRHEFGSLLDVCSEPEFRCLPEEMQDLVLHLIAAHHGRGRPHFDSEETRDPERGGAEASAIAGEVARRFARLQQRYGRWGLAYLESLLRAADYAASANPTFIPETQP